MKKILLSPKYILFFIVVIIFTLISTMWVNLDYAAKSKSRWDKAKYEGENTALYSKEEFNRLKSRNWIESFKETVLEIRESFTFDFLYLQYFNARTKVLPIILISTIYIFISLKNRLLKYNIGRNNLYEKEKKKLKLKLSLIVPLFSLFIVILLFIISKLVVGEIKYGKMFMNLFSKEDILGKIFSGTVNSLIAIEIIQFISLFILSLFVINLIDRYDVLNGILIFFILIWVIPTFSFGIKGDLSIINLFMPYALLVTRTIVGITLYKALMPIILTIIIIIRMNKLNKDEVEIN